MNIWHMQLHPGDASWSRNDIKDIVLNHKVIGLGEQWDGDRGQPEAFRTHAKIGDIVVIRHQGPLCIVVITSNCINNTGDDSIDVWFPIYRKVRILDFDAAGARSDFEREYKESWSSGIYAPATFQTANNWDFANYWYKRIIKNEMMNTYINLLVNNKNLILTGAPGTGKTYLAKEIAKQLVINGVYDDKNDEHKKRMDEQYAFVQFHPSYDYTDFVEGLRPVEDSSNITFRRKDGIFMEFCRKALKAYNETENKDEAPKYIFVIDEINRGELSKIFGELFFSIDPGYRGVEGKVKTQYSNLWKEEDMYDGGNHFFIPKNVYIIGTMNDIDRSVESMDFAMRRRFAFKEVFASDRVEMIKESDKLVDSFETIQKRMNNLNKCILTIQGLSSAYQIGPAYYLKLKNYLEDGQITDGSWDALWSNHIEGLLFEYLRGIPDATEQLEKLKSAFYMND